MFFPRTPLRAIAVAALVAAGSAHAVDFNGYFRAGPGATTEDDAKRACYSLPDSAEGTKYRLGNECDFYGEFALSQGFKAGSVDYKAYLMVNSWNGASDIGDSKVGINQMYAEGKGFDFAPGTNFWIGKRFYKRADVHIVDTFFTNLSGVGAGADGIDVGVGKFGVAFFKDEGDANKRINVMLHEVAANPGGKLNFTGTITEGRTAGSSETGFTLGVQHQQDNFLGLGGGNSLWVQYAQGPSWLNGGSAGPSRTSNDKNWRIVESFTWQQGKFGGQALALYQFDEEAGGSERKTISLGGRASYAVTNNFKLVGEAGYSQRKRDNGPTGKLSKLTFAPTISTGPGFWNRPELRFYVTYAKWNTAAGNVTGEAAFTNKTSGVSYGAQAEMWF